MGRFLKEKLFTLRMQTHNSFVDLALTSESSVEYDGEIIITKE